MATVADGGSRCMQDPTKHRLNAEACAAGIPCHPVTRQRVCQPEPETIGMVQGGWTGTGKDWCKTHEANWPLGLAECSSPGVGACREGDRPVADPQDPEPVPGMSTPAEHAAWLSRQPVALSPKEALARDLNQWWMDIAHEEAIAVVDKAVEYGANSMTELGHEIAKLSGRKISDGQAIELACYFYIKGKMGRWSDAIVAGKDVSDDTLGDIGVYVRMAQRVRSNGGWPGTVNETKEV